MYIVGEMYEKNMNKLFPGDEIKTNNCETRKHPGKMVLL
ncbi:hypothetical protein B4140_0635 [Bacillus amyloliquefaciens]|nr:hypothetical protein B4140_0635 [Bacillus amyloliquefaciens]RAP11770.1 hypothetical protein HS9_03382 [Bacillus velezensis]